VAVALHPTTHATAWNNLGRLLHVRAAQHTPSPPVAAAAATWADAGGAYRTAVRVSPTYATAWFNLGLWHGAATAALGAAAPAEAAPDNLVDGAFAFRRAAALAAAQGQASLRADALGKLGDLQLRTALDAHRAHAKQQQQQQQDTAATCTDPSHDHSHSHHSHAQTTSPRGPSPLEMLEEAITVLLQLQAIRPGDAHSKSMLAFARAQRPKLKKGVRAAN
jgi:hypothetical protein